MSEWKEYKTTDLLDQGILVIGDGYRAKNVELSATKLDGLPFARVGNINGGFNFHEADYFPTNNLKRVGEKISKVGDVVFTSKGTVGRFAYVNEKSSMFVYSPQLCFWRSLNHGFIFPRFLFYWMQGREFFEQADAVKGQTDMADYVNLSDQRKMKINLPEINEQRAIAAVLSSLDDKIDLLHRQNDTLEAMADTLFKQWFVVEANIDSISQLVYIQNGYAFKSKDFKENGSNGVVKIKNISGGIIDIEKTDFIDEGVAKSVQNRFKILTGDILIAMTGAEIGKLGIIPKTDKNLWLNQRVGLLKEKFSGSKYLAYLQLKSVFGQDYIENTATGSAQPNISGTGIENCGFPRLPEEKIKEYSLQIGELYEKVIFNLGQIRSLTALRDTLLPKLMSGEVRVKINN